MTKKNTSDKTKIVDNKEEEAEKLKAKLLEFNSTNIYQKKGKIEQLLKETSSG